MLARREAKKRVLLSGLITALGIALHNFPEGVAVFLASYKSSAVGASLAIAIALHNVPEGVAVALPVYFATGSRCGAERGGRGGLGGLRIHRPATEGGLGAGAHGLVALVGLLR